MKRCSQCGEREGVIDLTHIEGAEVKTLHLCAKCAAEKGIQTVANVGDTPLGGLLAALGGAPAAAMPISGLGGDACPACGATLQDFRETGRLGCAECYRTFAEPLRELLRRLHGSAHHTGKQYLPPPRPETPGRQPSRANATALRDELRRAIEAEEFELAAKLRDQLKEVE